MTESEMKSIDIASHLLGSVPSFQDVHVVGPGFAYHYTIHADSIEAAGKFLGAPLDKNLDCAQNPDKANVAVSDPGVVFAYADLAEAAEEGDCARYVYSGSTPEIFEIHYSAAVRATHIQEAQLDAPPTILISSVEITSFKRLGPCSENYDEKPS